MIGRGDAGGGAGVAEAEEGLGLEEELGDGGGRTGVDLALQVVHAVLHGRGLGMRIGIGADAERELAGLGQRLDQVDGAREAVRVRGEAARALGRVAAQRDDLGHAGLGVASRRSPAFLRGWRRRRSDAPRRDAVFLWIVLTASWVSARVVPPAP
jgi:hypothetical protein